MAVTTASPGVDQRQDARLRIHAAAQWLARIAIAYRDPQDGDAHTALHWDRARRAIALGPFTGPKGDVMFTLTPTDLEVRLHRGAMQIEAGGVALAGHDEDARHDGVARLCEAAGFEAEALRRALPYKPAPPPAPDPNAPQSDAAMAWSDLWAQTQHALERLTAGMKRAGPVRIWPHHFDMAVLIPVGRKRGKNAQSVGIGVAPDDVISPTPYFYAAPWPYPPKDDWPDAPPGWTWRNQGFTGLITQADRALAPDAPPLTRALKTAYDTCLASLGITT